MLLNGKKEESNVGVIGINGILLQRSRMKIDKIIMKHIRSNFKLIIIGNEVKESGNAIHVI